MQSEPTERLKSESSARPRAITLIVVVVVVLAVILAWLLGFFTWLLS
jgi:hypothetical protein